MATDLQLNWATHQAARYACDRWHYSRSMPAGKTVKIGVWEQARFIGVIVFAWGANQHLGRFLGLTMFQVAELCRVALGKHATPVTRMVAIALKMLKRQSPGLRLVISYADCDQKHHGGIYAGGNWTYLGKTQTNGGTPRWRIHGDVVHGRTVYSRWGRGSQNLEWLRAHVDPAAEAVYTDGKHKFAMGLDPETQAQLAPMAQPYPKRADEVTPGDTAGVQPAKGGSRPTHPLHLVEPEALDEAA